MQNEELHILYSFPDDISRALQEEWGGQGMGEESKVYKVLAGKAER
jgi:hypothetical protein